MSNRGWLKKALVSLVFLKDSKEVESTFSFFVLTNEKTKNTKKGLRYNHMLYRIVLLDVFLIGTYLVKVHVAKGQSWSYI